MNVCTKYHGLDISLKLQKSEDHQSQKASVEHECLCKMSFHKVLDCPTIIDASEAKNPF